MPCVAKLHLPASDQPQSSNMEKISMNGNGAALAEFETPFADIKLTKEQSEQNISSEDFYSNYSQEFESPFSRSFEAASTGNVSEAGEDYVDLLSELHDSEFGETIYELVNEVEDSWRNKVSNEIAMGSNYIPFATQQAREYFAPLIRESENMIDRVAEHFSGNNLADHSPAELEQLFESLEFNHSQYTPVQEQFFGKLFDKVKSVVKKGVDLAKKGISFVGKFMPINIILNKIKGLIKPLLDKVLKFAIGKLPQNLQPYAKTLATKFLNMETENEGGGEAGEGEDELEAIQTELDNHLAQLLFTSNEPEAEATVMNYESSFEQIERNNNYETGYSSNLPSLDSARQQFINELKDLPAGESPTPAIERFLPAVILALQPVIKIAISLIGRQKIINFLAGLLAKLVGKYVPENVAQPLAASIIDVGLSAIGFETYENGKSDLAFEAIANTIQETVQNMTGLDETTLNNSEDLTAQLLEAFEKAAADNFPPQYIKEDLRPTQQKAVWVSMPRNTPVKLYKKFTHVYEVSIDPQTASRVKAYRNLPLVNFLRDKYGLDVSRPVKARVHIYQLNKGSRLSMISRLEKLPGLNAKQPKAWIQLLPLTREAASLILKEPSLGRDFSQQSLATRFRAKAGHRFYFLEIEGARLRIPPTTRTSHKHVDNGKPGASTESRSADIQAVINFIKSEIRLNYYFSEEDARAIVEKLNKNDFLGAALGIRQSVKNLLNDILIKNISSKVKIVHEAMPELYLENYAAPTEGFSPLDSLGKYAGREIISKLVEQIVEKLSTMAYEALGNFFKARAAEFKDAQAKPDDGVTVKFIWTNVPGMSAIRAVINAIRGNLSVGNLSNLSMPSFTSPDIKIEAGKNFD
jgi:hypothetical protein